MSFQELDISKEEIFKVGKVEVGKFGSPKVGKSESWGVGKSEGLESKSESFLIWGQRVYIFYRVQVRVV